MGHRLQFVIVAVMAIATLTAHVEGQLPASQRSDSGPAVSFENITKKAGISFILTAGTPSKLFLVESMGGGVAFIDYDNDGWVDLFFVNGSTLEDARLGRPHSPNRLYRNNGDGAFTDVTEKARVAGRSWGMGVCVGDVNNDGFGDIYVTNLGPNTLYLNNGDGTFRDVSKQAGIEGDAQAWSSSCAFADYDIDGDLDLYVSNYMTFDVFRPPERSDDGSRCVYQGLEVACGPIGLAPRGDRFHENTGDGTFRDVTERSGVGKVTPSFGMGVVWGDYDNDGHPDIYVANDEMPNFLFHNNGDKTFTDVAAPAGVALNRDGRAQGSMGVDLADYDNDGDLDLIVTNFADDYHTLYVNEGNGTFADRSRESGLIGPIRPVGWGAWFADLDLDGLLDLSIANGHSYPQLGRLPALTANGRGYWQRNFLFRNLGNGRFAEIGEHAGAGFRARDARSSRGLAAGDINNDGLMDLVITSLDEPPSLLMNRSRPGNWVLVKLKGAKSNRSAIGASVLVRTGPRTQRREVKSGGSYQSQSDLRLHFGLGAASRIDELTVRWPSGRVETRRDVEANRILTVLEQ